MKQKLLCLATLMGMASVAFAQNNIELDLSSAGDWKRTPFAKGGCEITFTEEYQGLNIGSSTGWLNVSEYKGVEVVMKGNNTYLQFALDQYIVDDNGDFVLNSSNEKTSKGVAWPQFIGSKTGTVIFADHIKSELGEAKLSDKQIKLVLHSKSKTEVTYPVTVAIENIYLIDKNDYKIPAAYYKDHWATHKLSNCDCYGFEIDGDYQIIGFNDIDLKQYRQIKVEFAEEVTDDLLIWGNYTTTEGGEGYCLGEYGGGILKGKSGIQTYDLPAADMAKDGICKVAGIMKDPKAEGAQSICLKSMTLVSSKSTPVKGLNAQPEVVSTEYYSVSGCVSSEPHKGINIVKERLSNGDIRISRIVKR